MDDARANSAPADRNGHRPHTGWTQPVTGSRPVRTVGRAVRYRWRPAAGVILACLVVAGGLVVMKPKTFSATALLFVDERHNSSQGFDLALQAAELMSHHYLEMATSRAVLERACFGPDAASFPPATVCDPTSLASHVRADTVRGTSLISIQVSARSPDVAAALANAVANALVAQDQQQVADLLGPTRDYLDAQLQELSHEIQAEKASLPSGGTSPHLVALESQYTETYARRQDIALEEFRLAGCLSVIQTAQPPVRPADPDPLRYMLAGLVAGVALGFVTALSLEYFDGRVREPEDLARAAGAAVVVAVPRTARGRSSAAPARTYALAHAGLLATQPNTRRVLVAAASPRDQAEVAARGLATAAIEGGQDAVVIEDASEAQRPAGPNDLRVIAAPSPDVSSRALNLAGSADLAVVVATAGNTRFDDARRTAEMLRAAGAQVAVGILLPNQREPQPRKEEPA